MHPCGGSGTSWYSGTRLPSYADKNGFILIYPDTPNMSHCWDVQNAATLSSDATIDRHREMSRF